MRARGIVTAVLAAMLALTACGDGGGLNRFDPVPESAWPILPGVQVVSSRGYAGNECCESHSAVREFLVNVDSTADFEAASDLVVNELRDAGWSDFDCVHIVCMRQGEYRVALWHPRGREKRGNTDILIRLTRDANVGG